MNEVNREYQLRRGLVALNEREQLKGKNKTSNLHVGDFVFDRTDVKKRHKQALKILNQNYRKDSIAYSLGFGMGATSILDVLIGAKHCFLVPRDTKELIQQKCLFVFLCRFANVYVLGEHTYFDEDAYSLPGIESVDKFQNKKVKDLAESVAGLMQSAGCERLYAAELAGSLPHEISIESNLVLNEPVLFDGYFWWTD